ncbi:MAG TPA: hypothetical protein PLV68_00890, partial [Ilumatobacteraceae bacterium]|nr:hypothetical protein [Ilumatobacteraceae bacterium]
MLTSLSRSARVRNWTAGLQRLTDSLGVQRRMAVAIGLSGLTGGVIGAAYLTVLDVTNRAIGPGRWSPGPHLVILALVGVTVAALVKWLGPPANVELLVDNIHVPGMS